MSKKYKIVKSDLCIAGKIYKEGSVVNFIDESLKNFFEPLPEEKTISKEKITIADTSVAADPAETSSNPELSFRPEGEILTAPSTETIIQSTKKIKPKKVTEAI